MPAPTSPPSLILEPPEGTGQEDAPLPLPLPSLFPQNSEVNRADSPAPPVWVEQFRFTDAPADAPAFVVPRFDRTLSEYVNTLTGAGFVLKRLEEPRPSEAYCQVHPGQRGWRDHAALFVHVLAEKPA